jgi:hypothetical protein
MEESSSSSSVCIVKSMDSVTLDSNLAETSIPKKSLDGAKLVLRVRSPVSRGDPGVSES